MADRVAEHPIGIGEPLAKQYARERQKTWERVAARVTPEYVQRFVSHLELSQANRPGFAPVLVGMTEAGVPAGSQQSLNVYRTAWETSMREDATWDDILIPGDVTGNYEKAHNLIRTLQGELYGENPVSYHYSELPEVERPEDPDPTWFGAFKGTSRWFFALLDVIPEGIDALGRGIINVKQGRMTPAEVIGGLTGFDRTAAQVVGVPFFQYLHSVARGERINMGTGYFASQHGEIASDIQEQLALYDAETHGYTNEKGEVLRQGLTQADFDRRKQKHGAVIVPGPAGATYEARSLEEWKFLRDTAGRGALLASLQYTSPEQQALGQPHGLFGEILDEATLVRTDQLPQLPDAVVGGVTAGKDPKGTYFSHSTGRVLGATLYEPGSLPFNIMSGAADATKQLADLNLLGLGLKVLGRGGKAVGLAGEAADLHHGAAVMEDILRYADDPAKMRVADDLLKGTINTDAAVNALARGMDDSLQRAINARLVAKTRATKAAEKTGDTPLQIDRLLGRARSNNIARDILRNQGGMGDEVDNLVEVMRRPGVDLTQGLYGTAQVGEDVITAARKAVSDLDTLRNSRKASTYMGPDGGIRLTFDADLGRAQQTLFKLYDQIDAQHLAAKRLQEIQGPRGTRLLSGDDLRVRARLRNEMQALGVDPLNFDKVNRLANASDAYIAGRKSAIGSNLLVENQNFRIGAANMLGASHEALDEVDNLTRVLKRATEAETLVNNAGELRRLQPGQISDLMTGKGAAEDIFDSLADTQTIRQTMAVLGPTVEFGGRNIPVPVIKALTKASSREEIFDVFMKNPLLKVMPQPVSLMGRYRRVGAGLTAASTVTGAGLSGYQEYEAGGDFGDVFGATVFGAGAGFLGGSALSGGLGLIGHAAGSEALTRGLQSKADVLGLVFSGGRASTSMMLTAAGHDPARALAGLSAPSQMTYAFGHSALGRRIARHAVDEINPNDPSSVFYGLLDFSRVYGFESDEVAHVFTSPAEDIADRVLLRNAFDSDEAWESAVADLLGEGFERGPVHDMDEIFQNMADMVPKNPYDGYAAMRQWANGADAILQAKGINQSGRSILTEFIEGVAKEFEGNVNGMGRPADYMQAKVNGQFIPGSDVQYGAKSMAEQWGGKVQMPNMIQVQRVMMQSDAFGRVQQVLTGKGIFGPKGTFWDELLKRGFTADQVRDWKKAFTPEWQRNVLANGTRKLMIGLWSPMMLVTRPLAFLSRVFGEDQGRMVASDLDNIFTHPINYFSSLLANFDWWKQQGKLRGVTARSLISSHDLYDETGELVDDIAERLGNAGISETVMQQLHIYDRRLSRQSRHGRGVVTWRPDIPRTDPNYIGAVATEFRQVLTDPMARELASSTSATPVDDLAEKLINGWNRGEGHFYNLMRDWGAQFTADGVTGTRTDQFLRYIEDPDHLKAFLSDQWARLHLKTGGDWVFKVDEIVLNSSGEVIDEATVAANGWDQLNNGYTILRRGDDELLDVVATQRIRDYEYRLADQTTEIVPEFELKGNLSDQKWEAIKDLVNKKNTRWKGQVGRLEARSQIVPMEQHQFPAFVKGAKTEYLRGAGRYAGDGDGFKALADDAVEYIFDTFLGGGSRVLSRQPVLGNHFWEDVAVLYPMMTDDVKAAFKALAEAEGRWDEVAKIADAAEASGVATGVLDDFDAVMYHAQAYAVERTKDMLFDLTRERNFIDAYRVVTPFMGPMVEAFEAWTRVIREDPIRIWRRGGQIYNHLWNTSPLAVDTEHFWADWTVTNPKGMFWTDEDGVEHISVPFSQNLLDALRNIEADLPVYGRVSGEGIKGDTIDMKLRGFNVVFGPDDLRATSDPMTAGGLGLPTEAFNPGLSPAVTISGPLLRDREGFLADFRDWVFPYGTPPDGWSMFMPYHLRVALEGMMGADSRHQFVSTTVENFGAMIANGEAGDGDQYQWPLRTQAEVQAAWREAENRARGGNIVEAVLRGSLPTFVTPEFMVEIPKLEEMGVDTDMLLSLGALVEFGRDLYSERGAEWFQTEDGFLVSTEGDWEVVTSYMNRYFGLNIFSADMLKLSTSKTERERAITDVAAPFNRKHQDGLLSELPQSGAFIMADYATARDEEYSFTEREAAIRRGDITMSDPEEIKVHLQSRLIAMRERAIRLQAEYLYGDDQYLTTDEKRAKNFFIQRTKEAAVGRFDKEAIEQGANQKVFKELVTWDQITPDQWASFNLTSEEAATVKAVLWYLEARKTAYSFLERVGVSSLDQSGVNAAQEEMIESVIADIEKLVAAQAVHAEENGVDMGNFFYLYERFFRDEWVDVEERDALADLARARILRDADLEGTEPWDPTGWFER